MSEAAGVDEKGFVFLDRSGTPFLVRKWGVSTWLFYWHVEHRWVSLRQVTEEEAATFPRNLSDEEQKLYMDTHWRNVRGGA